MPFIYVFTASTTPGITSRRLFKVWKVCFLLHKSIGFILARHKLQLKSKSNGFLKTAKSSFTTSTGSCYQGNSKHLTIIRGRATWTNVSLQPLFFTNSSWSFYHSSHQQPPQEKKAAFWRSDADRVPISTATDKTCKGRKQNPEILNSPDPFELMMSYFDKRLEGIEKSYNNHQTKTQKRSTLSNSNINGTQYNLNSTNKF